MKGRMKRVVSIVMALLLGIGVPTAAVTAFDDTIVSEAATTYPGASLDTYAYSGDDLGAVYTPEATTFKVWAPSATRISLKLYATGSDSEAGAKSLGTYSMTRPNASNGVWTVKVEKDLVDVYYTYEVTTYGKTNEAVDIYAKAVGVNGNRGMIVDLDSDATNPEGWENDEGVRVANQTDAVIYELHVRDFSSDDDSGISDENQGKYLAFTENGTSLNGAGEVATGIDYLKDLGINYVHLLPVYDYASVDETKLDEEQFNWGYDPKNYNVPEGSYSTDPYDGNVRVKEFKEMVQSLHNEDIGVIMDVVYNHTFKEDNSVEQSWFHSIEPGYYHRMTSTGDFFDGSGCGNSTASERAMMRKYMIDSIVYWATEYHVDGFRFDLMGLHDTETMNLIRAALDSLVEINGEDILMYGEGWDGNDGDSGLPTGSIAATKSNAQYLDSRIAVFSDDVRDAIKGNVSDVTAGGFIQGNGYVENLKAAIKGKIIGGYGSGNWALSPSQVITYTSVHDNYTLWDKLVGSSGDPSSDYTNRNESLVSMNKLSAAIVLTSQGISLFQAGEEFARTKEGDHNSYRSSTLINQLDWTRMNEYSDLVDYYQGLIELRKAYTPFRDATTTSSDAIYYSYGTGFPSNVVAYTMQNKLTADTEFNTVAVLFNSNSTPQTVTLMNGNITLPTEWVVLVNDTAAGTKSLGEKSGTTITIPANSALVLVDKAGYNNWLKSSETVNVKHVDKDTGKVLKKETINGELNKTYTTSSSDFDGYKLVKTPDEATGTFTEDTITVTYEYESTTGSVVVKYVDKDTNKEIAAAETITGSIGDAYQTAEKEISGYVLYKQPDYEEGILEKGTKTVTYQYESLAGNVVYSVNVQSKAVTSGNKFVMTVVTSNKATDVQLCDAAGNNVNATLTNKESSGPVAVWSYEIKLDSTGIQKIYAKTKVDTAYVISTPCAQVDVK